MDSRSDKKDRKTVNQRGGRSDANEGKTCCICLSDVKNRAITDTCRHEFCFDCIRVWSNDHNRCPICRQTYQNIRYNIVSDQIYQELEVAQQPDDDDQEIEALLQRMLLYLQVISLRNRAQRQRDQINHELDQIKQKKQKNCSNRVFRAEVRKLRTEVRELDNEINQLNRVLSIDHPTDEDLLEVVENRDEVTDVQLFQVIQEIGEMDENDAIVVVNEDVDSEESGNQADDEDSEESDESEDSGDHENGGSARKRRANSDSSDDYTLKKRKH